MNTITTEQLKTLQENNEDFLLVNTLSEDAFKQTRIPGSENCPLEDENFLENVEELAGSKDRKVITYCASPECQSSSKAAQKLEEAGFSNVTEYEGGAKAWQDSGEKLTIATN